jgi:hypothetical protein
MILHSIRITLLAPCPNKHIASREEVIAEVKDAKAAKNAARK